MNININDFINGFSGFSNMSSTIYNIKVWLGDAIVENKKINMADFMAQQQFASAVHQLYNEKSPMKVRMSFDDYGEDNKLIENYIEYENVAWTNAHKNN